ncbi:SRPBCC family protein [Erythrobacter alti]|uniref:SRPBCC family protein n=1 Tax=Erythrobacter alti TaxID=1896145 RepID=UPI0030F46932
MKDLLGSLAIVLSCSGGAWAQDAEPVSQLVPVAEGEQALMQSLVLDAPVDEVWSRFTTSEGAASWMAPVAEVDLRSGGTISTNYNACATTQDSGTITLDIVNLVPERFLILQTDLSASSDAAWMNEAILERSPDMANLIEFEALGEGQTRVTSWGLGYGTGEEWEQVIGFFIAGNEWSFGQLIRALDGEQVWPACEASAN